MRTKRKGRTKTEPVSKKAPGMLNKFSLGIAVGVQLVLLSCCFGERKRTEALVISH